MSKTMTGAQMVIEALCNEGVTNIFGYPGGAILPVFDEIYKQEQRTRLILGRHEQGSVHAAEGYARSTGMVGVVLVTSGPGATNTVTGIADAYMDSIPLVVIAGQVPTHLRGSDAFQEMDIISMTAMCTKHSYMVNDIVRLPEALHHAFQIARSGKPGPVVIDLPKDIQIASGLYEKPSDKHRVYRPQARGDQDRIQEAVDMMRRARKPVFYTGGGVVNSGPKASGLLRELVRVTGFPITSTLMGLGAYPASDPQWLGMLGMHGTWEANHVMHDCDLMVCIGARFDDRVTGKLSKFSPHSKKIHIDIDRCSVNKIVQVDVPIVGNCGSVLTEMLRLWQASSTVPDSMALEEWWQQIGKWRERRSLAYTNSTEIIKPQWAIERLYHFTKGRDVYVTTDVGQHQMWTAQHFGFEQPNRLLTSGGLGTMGYGLPAAVGVQIAHPESLVVCITGDASIQMMLQEMDTASQYELPIKVLIINNGGAGMVKQWQRLGNEGRLSHSVMRGPDFVKLAEGYHAKGLRCTHPDELDTAIREMIDTPGAVVLDCIVDPDQDCWPMIPSGAAHNEMRFGPNGGTTVSITGEGKAMV